VSLPEPNLRGEKPVGEITMKSIVELINEVKGMDDLRFAERFELASLDVAYSVRIDFDNWLRKCVQPGRQFVDIQEAWGNYEKSFG
jgi:hypothetical protein